MHEHALELCVQVWVRMGGTQTPVQCWPSVDGSPHVEHLLLTQVWPFEAIPEAHEFTLLQGQWA